jgi:hypothetical protein
VKRDLDECFRVEKEEKRKANFLKAKEFDQVCFIFVVNNN